MRTFLSMLAVLGAVSISQAAQADEFGTRFYGETHSALADSEPEDMDGFGLQDIEPAAGGEISDDPNGSYEPGMEDMPQEGLDKTEE